ncbi:Zinc finger protein [Plakobranchus ocellatus]|uniref:Zinc finger protein n=1 Tax=Plakobranchus ocellatus TaxID=259542 RepID=A0AAV4BEU3_9GAST|nr:Zinc finger protein [Plakobranchus ocellatus]
MENLGIIRNNNSSLASSVILVEEKESFNRVFIDYQRLNKQTILYPHFISHADVFQGMENHRYFSKQGLLADTCPSKGRKC